MLFGLRFRRVLRCAPWLLFAFGIGRPILGAQTLPYAGTLPEDYLPGLKTILQTALNQSPQILLHQIEISQSEARIYDADQQRWPNVGGDMRYDSNRTAISSDSATQSRDSGLFYSLSANQALFYWGEIKHKGDIARIEVAISKKDYTEAYRSLAVELRRSYLGLIARNAELRQRRFALGLLAASVASGKEAIAHGTISSGDLAGRQLNFDENQLQVDRLQADFDGERRRFSRLAGIADLPVDQIPIEIPEPRYDEPLASQLLAALMRDGAKGTSATQIADLKAKEADLNYRIARVRLLPKFNASLSHSRESSTTASTSEVSQTAITRDTLEVRGSWSIFDGFATRGAKLAAQADKRYWQRREQIEADSAMDEAQRLERTIGLDARAVRFAEQRRVSTVGLVEKAKSELKAGASSGNELNDATQQLRMAEANAAFSRATFLSDWAAFVSLVADDPVLSNLSPRYVRDNR